MRILLAALVLAIAPADDKKPEGDLAKLQGSWKTMAGPKKDTPQFFEVTGEDFTLTIKSLDGHDYVFKGRLKLDDTAQPKSMDWASLVAPNGKDVPDARAIYKIEGDSLTLCSAFPGRDRPAKFLAEGDAPEPGVNQTVYTREKAENPK